MGSVAKQAGGQRPISVVTDEMKEDVRSIYRRNPHLTQRQVVQHLTTPASLTSTHKAIKAIHFHGYKPQSVQMLSEEDFPKRVAFCEASYFFH